MPACFFNHLSRVAVLDFSGQLLELALDRDEVGTDRRVTARTDGLMVEIGLGGERLELLGKVRLARTVMSGQDEANYYDQPNGQPDHAGSILAWVLDHVWRSHSTTLAGGAPQSGEGASGTSCRARSVNFREC